MGKQFSQLLIIQFKEFFREPGALFWSFIFPILMSFALGMAFTDKPEITQHAAVVLPTAKDSSILNSYLNTKCKKSSVAKFEFQNTVDNNELGKTTTHFLPTTLIESERMMKRGQIEIILTENNGKINYHFDPANSASRLAYMTISAMIDGKNIVSKNAVIKPLQTKGTRYIDFLVPGLLAMGIMSSCLWGISYGLIEKRSKKLLRRLVATPMKKYWFMITMFISRFVFAILETIALLTFAYFVFGVTIQGSMIAFAAILISGSFFFMGLSILLASRTANTQVGNGFISAITMPMMLLSGVFFSYSNFPDVVIPIIKYLPLTLFADSLRSIINEGYGVAEIMKPLLILSLTGLGTFFVGLKIYKWY
ncbi:MAG: ABC transporter permease [Bacteroidetes bacterium]|nr:ABC transporter permease [Bacteroidota bacterium]